MRIQIIKCDNCGKEIDGNPIKIFVNDVDRDTGDIIGDNEIAESIELRNCDFCQSCIRHLFVEEPEVEPEVEVEPEPKIEDIIPDAEEFACDQEEDSVEYEPSEDEIDLLGKISGGGTNTHPVEDKPVIDQQKTVKETQKKFDYGKLIALTNAGWSAKQIAGEMGISEATVYTRRWEVKNGKVKL